MFAVVVTLEVQPDAVAEFDPLIRAQAENSTTKEPGCLTFEVWSEGTTFFLYEVYASPEAFQTHLKTDHFARFDQAAAALLVSKAVQTFTRKH